MPARNPWPTDGLPAQRGPQRILLQTWSKNAGAQPVAFWRTTGATRSATKITADVEQKCRRTTRGLPADYRRKEVRDEYYRRRGAKMPAHNPRPTGGPPAVILKSRPNPFTTKT